MALSDLFGGVANLFKNAVSEDEQDNTPNTQDSEPQYTTNSSFSFKGNPASFQVNERPFRGADLIRPAEFHDQSPAIRQLFDFDIRTGGDPAVNLADFQAKMRDSVVRSFELEQAQIRDVTQKINDNQQTIVSELQKFSERYSALERTFGDANERIRYLESNLEQTQYTLSRQKETSTKKRSYGNPVRKSANAITNALESFGQILMGGAIATYLGKQVFDWVQSPEGWKEFKDQIWPKILSDVLEPLNQNMAERFRASRDELLNTIKNDIAPVVGRWIEDNPGKFAAAVALATKNPIAGAGAYTAGKLYGFYDFYANDKQDDPEYRKKTAQDIEALKRTTEKWGRENHIDLSKGLHSTENFVSPHGYGGGIVRGPSDYSSFGDMGNQMMLNLQGGFSATENFVSPHGYGGGAQRSSSDASVSSGQGDSSGGKQAPQTNDVGQIKPQSYLAPQDNDMGVYDDRSSWQKFYDWVFGGGNTGAGTGSGKFGPGWHGFGGGGGGGSGGDYTPSGPPQVLPKISALQALLEPPKTGSAWLKERRAKLAAEVNANPALKREVYKMAELEDGPQRTAVIEALFNRALMTNNTIEKELNSGFYSTVKSGRSKGGISESSYTQSDEAFNAVVNGSNIIQGRTNQGMATDSGGGLPGRVAAPHTSEVFNFWEGSRNGKSFGWRDSQKFADDVNEHVNSEPKSTPGAVLPGMKDILDRSKRAYSTLASVQNKVNNIHANSPVSPQGALPSGQYSTSNDPRGMSYKELVGQGVNTLEAESLFAGGREAFGDPNDPSTRYVVIPQGGMRNQSTGLHGRGLAVDLQIWDRGENRFIGGRVGDRGAGRIMENAFGNPENFRTYEILSQARYQWALKQYGPDVASKMSWGGQFNHSLEGTGPDEMHYSLGELKYNPQGHVGGNGPNWLAQNNAQPSKGMGSDPANWKSPLNPANIPKPATPVVPAVAKPAPEAPPQPKNTLGPNGGINSQKPPQANPVHVQPKHPTTGNGPQNELRQPAKDVQKGGVRSDTGTKSTAPDGGMRVPKSNWETQGPSAGDAYGTGSNFDACCYL